MAAKVDPNDSVSLVLDFAKFAQILVFNVILGVVHLDEIACDVLNLLNFATHAGDVTSRKASGLESPEDVNVSIFKHTRRCVVPSLVELRREFKPAVFFNVVALNGPLALLKVLELNLILVSSTSDGINIPLIPLGVGEVSAAVVHKFTGFEHFLLEHVLVVLGRVDASNQESSESFVSYYRSVPFGDERRRDFHLVPRPWVGPCVVVVVADLSEQKSA